MFKSPITCHVLDSSIGKPATSIKIKLQHFKPGQSKEDFDIFEPLAEGVTNSDGRCTDLLSRPDYTLMPGSYKIVFRTKEYFEKRGVKTLYPWVEIPFTVDNPQEHYHIPLLISPFSYTTYRGS